MEKDKKVALYFLAASILAPTALLVAIIALGVDLGGVLPYILVAFSVLSFSILIVYMQISSNASYRIRRYTMIAIPSIAGALFIAFVIVTFFLLGSGSVSADLDDGGLDVSAPFVNEHISYQDMDRVELRSDVDYGSRTSGYAGNDLLSGNYRNDEFGSYKLAIQKSTSNCIVVHHSDGILVFNLDSSDNTERYYNDLLSRIPGDMT